MSLNTTVLNTGALNASSAGAVTVNLGAVNISFVPGQVAQTASISDLQARTATLFYKLYVTDGNSVVEIPMQSFQAQYRDFDVDQQAGTTYLEVVIPGIDFATVLDAATRIIVNKGLRQVDGTSTELELIAGDIETIRYDQGARNASTIVSAREAFSNGAARSRDLATGFYHSTDNGRITYRGPVSFLLRPGDTANLHDGSVFDVDTISYLVGENIDEMTVTAVPPPDA